MLDRRPELGLDAGSRKAKASLTGGSTHEISGFPEHCRRTTLCVSVHVDALAVRTLHVTNSRDAAVLDVPADIDDRPRPRLANRNRFQPCSPSAPDLERPFLALSTFALIVLRTAKYSLTCLKAGLGFPINEKKGGRMTVSRERFRLTTWPL